MRNARQEKTMGEQIILNVIESVEKPTALICRATGDDSHPEAGRLISPTRRFERIAGLYRRLDSPR